MPFQLVKILGQTTPVFIPGGLTPRGAYDSGTDYAVGDSVDYQGSSYVMFLNAPANTVPTDTTYWQVLANKGNTGSAGANGADGANGTNGTNGTNGADSIVPGPQGPTGADGPAGSQGIQGIHGATGNTGAAGAGVVAGGTIHQALTKVNSTDFNTQWETIDKTFVGLSAVPNVDPTVVTTQNVINTTNLDTAITNLDDSISSQKETGFGAWTSGTDANTYTITGEKFQLDRSGYGYINGKKIVWTVSGTSHQTGVLSANTFYSVYIDAAGAIQTATVPFTANVIRLYEVLYDGTIYQVAKENHPKEFPSAVSGFLHKSIGTIIEGTGANITRVASGTGASADDRRVKIVGADVLSDHGLETTITAQNPITWNVYYRNGSGKWVRDSQVTELPIKYNNAGTPTALDVTNAYAEYVLYVIKDDIESSAPQYIAVMGETSYTVLATLLAAITAGSSIYSTNELANMEAAQLGYAVVQYSATGGYIEELQIAKSTLNQQIVGGGGTTSDHSLLTNLDYASAGHTGFTPSARTLTINGTGYDLSANRSWTISGTGITRSVNAISSPATAGATAATDYVYLVSGTTTLTMPTAVGNTNLYTIKNVDTNTVTIGKTGAETIDGATSVSLITQYSSIDLISNGSVWLII